MTWAKFFLAGPTWADKSSGTGRRYQTRNTSTISEILKPSLLFKKPSYVDTVNFSDRFLVLWKCNIPYVTKVTLHCILLIPIFQKLQFLIKKKRPFLAESYYEPLRRRGHILQEIIIPAFHSGIHNWKFNQIKRGGRHDLFGEFIFGFCSTVIPTMNQIAVDDAQRHPYLLKIMNNLANIICWLGKFVEYLFQSEKQPWAWNFCFNLNRGIWVFPFRLDIKRLLKQ